MAIIKTISHKGFYPEYWMIHRELYNKVDDTTNFWIAVYKDKPTRIFDKSDFIKESEKNISLLGKCSTAQGYTAFKALPYFEGAIDDL